MNRLDEVLKRTYEKLGITKDNQFCDMYDIKANTLSTWKKREKVPYELLEKISQNENISLDYLLFGSINGTKSIKLNDEGYSIDRLNVKAGAGDGIYNYEVEVVDQILIPKIFFKITPDAASLKIIEVDGDSMEPTLHSGDFILVDEKKNHGVDGIYAINLQGQILVKRLDFNLDGTIDIKSDNPAYSTKNYNPDDTQVPLHIIGMKTLTVQR